MSSEELGGYRMKKYEVVVEYKVWGTLPGEVKSLEGRVAWLRKKVKR